MAPGYGAQVRRIGIACRSVFQIAQFLCAQHAFGQERRAASRHVGRPERRTRNRAESISPGSITVLYVELLAEANVRRHGSCKCGALRAALLRHLHLTLLACKPGPFVLRPAVTCLEQTSGEL